MACRPCLEGRATRMRSWEPGGKRRTSAKSRSIVIRSQFSRCAASQIAASDWPASPCCGTVTAWCPYWSRMPTTPAGTFSSSLTLMAEESSAVE